MQPEQEMVRYFIYIGALLFTLLLLVACNKEEPIPAYIHIESFQVDTNPNTQGSSSNNLKDVWVYRQDGNVQGVYELPATFPLLEEGNTLYTFEPGILMNGVSTTRVSYPFLAGDTMVVNLQPGEIDTVQPVVEYRDNIDFLLIDDFDQTNSFTNMETVSNPPDCVFEGPRSATLATDSFDLDFNELFAYTTETFEVPPLQQAVFMEFDYKATHRFWVGIAFQANDGSTVELFSTGINPRDEWNHLYANHTPNLNIAQADEYRFFFYTELPDDTTQPEDILVFIDNVKIISFQN